MADLDHVAHSWSELVLVSELLRIQSGAAGLFSSKGERGKDNSLRDGFGLTLSFEDGSSALRIQRLDLLERR